MRRAVRTSRGALDAVLIGLLIPLLVCAADDVIHANNRGAAMMEQYKHAQAVEEFRRVTLGAPAWAPGFVNLGLAALYARDIEAAKEAFVEAIRIDPSIRCDTNTMIIRSTRRAAPSNTKPLSCGLPLGVTPPLMPRPALLISC